MLDMARMKLGGGIAAERIAIANAETLDTFAEGAIDLVSISFAMKICDRHKVMAEALRVLRPGGTFICLEAARIPLGPVHALYLAYMRLCMPLVGRLATGGDRSAYDYLLQGVHSFPDQKVFAAELAAAGYEQISWRNLTLGIVALHEGRKPA
jgi:demethylmenaquinone methyltransferase/2-methoxy-6-polyprenyl-1,4-benzoquinol methylase